LCGVDLLRVGVAAVERRVEDPHCEKEVAALSSSTPSRFIPALSLKPALPTPDF
jgi:hypothetical protein